MSRKHDKGKFASDRYLDDEKFAGKWRRSDSKKLKKGPEAQESLPWGDANATVSELFKGMCRVVLDSEPRELLCTYRRTQIWGQATGRDEEVRERSPVCVGDRVKVSVLGSKDGVVEGVCQRRNQLARPAPERDEVIHVLVANLDALVIVTATVNPDFSPGLVDRFMIAAAKQGIPCILVVNKIELWNGGEAKPWRLYQDLGIPIFETSAKKGPGVEALGQAIEGKHVAFCGHSGVGKTSLLNALVGEFSGETGNVNDFTGKGKHTTTGARLIMAGKGAFWVDTPGVRAFGLLGVDEANLHQLFTEFKTVTCALGEHCLHQGEDGCAVTGMPRYESYRRILTAIHEET